MSSGALRTADDLQLHAAGIVDLLLGEKLAIGLVPNFVANPDPRQDDEDHHLGLGVIGQFYMSESTSLIAGYASGSEIVGRAPEDSFSAGIELEVGGHFLKVVVTNSLRLNPAQFYTGALEPIELDNLRFGFNITRLFAF